jgi:Skp family chaperone for outer membrane proteins
MKNFTGGTCVEAMDDISVAGLLERKDMRRKLAIMLVIALLPISGVAACGQAVEDRVKQEVDKQVQEGQKRLDKELEKGQKKLKKETGKVRKQVEEGAQDMMKQADKKDGSGQ